MTYYDAILAILASSELLTFSIKGDERFMTMIGENIPLQGWYGICGTQTSGYLTTEEQDFIVQIKRT